MGTKKKNIIPKADQATEELSTLIESLKPFNIFVRNETTGNLRQFRVFSDNYFIGTVETRSRDYWPEEAFFGLMEFYNNVMAPRISTRS